MSAEARPQRLRTPRLLRVSALLYFYRRRLRAHAVQELLAGVGIAVAVALVLATGIAQSSIAGSTRQVLRAVIGPADLQLRARGSNGFPEAMLTRVEALGGVGRAAPLLERSARITGAHGRSQSVYIAGTDVSLGVLNGLGSALPLGAMTPGTIALSASTGRALGLDRPIGSHTVVNLDLGGIEYPLRVSALLDKSTVGALAGAAVAVMPLSEMQALTAQSGLVTRILVQSAPGRHALVGRELGALAGPRLAVAGSEQDIALLQQALRPSAQASTLFAIIGALLGMLLAFNAIMLTVPERRQAIADLRLSGTRRSAIVQLALFQGLCLGILSTIVGLGVGYALSRWVFHQSTSYLAEAFALAGGTVIPAAIVLATALAGVIVTLLATMVPLLDLRSGLARDAVYQREPDPGSLLGGTVRKLLLAATLTLLAATSILYATWPAGALAASCALALATVLAVPVTFAAAMRAAHALSERAPRLSTLAIALGGVRGTSIRSIALAATGAVALFGSVALGGARSNLLAGIHSFAHAYAADAPIWISEPNDNQATGEVLPANLASIVARQPGIQSVAAFDGAFLTVGPRRVWVIARPPGATQNVIVNQVIDGRRAARLAQQRLDGSGWVALSAQLAEELHVGVGATVTLPTPSGPRRYRVAALTSNLAWSPGVAFMSAADFQRAWHPRAPSTLAAYPQRGIDPSALRDDLAATLAHEGRGLEVATSATRAASIDRLTDEGLGQLGVISTLLVLAAIMALAAALASSIHQRRPALAGLRLSGAAPARLRRILLVEAGLMLGAGCLTGAFAGVYGQFVIDAYLRHVTGFPVLAAASSTRPLLILAIVLGAALLSVAAPAWMASRISPSLALADE